MSLLNVITREITRILTIQQFYLIFFVAIFFYAAYYPQPYKPEVLRDVPIAIIDNDGTVTSRQLARNIDATGNVRVLYKLPSVAAAKHAIMSREIDGFLYIPQYFERDLLHGRQSPLALYGDASYFLIFSNTKSAISSVVKTLGASIAAKRIAARGFAAPAVAAMPVRVDIIPLFNPEGGYASYTVPSAFILIVQQFLLMGIGLLNTMTLKDGARAIASPEITLLGKILVYLPVGLLLYLIACTIVPDIYGVPRIGHLDQSLLLAAPFILAVIGMGIAISSLVRDPLIVQVLCSSLGLPLFFLSGVPWPRESIPEWLDRLSLFIPSSTAIDAVVRVNQMNATTADLKGNIQVLCILAAVYLCLAFVAESIRQHREKAHKADETGKKADTPA